MKKDETGSYIWGFHEETPSERKLAAAMRKAGIRFGREVPVKGFTVDFLLDEWLIVEVDGESHLVSGRREKDMSRQKVLEGAGFAVLRIPAKDLSSDSGQKRWLKRIRDNVNAGPPYLSRGSFANQDYRRQVDEVRKALQAGETERRRREALASMPKERSGGAAGDRGSRGPAFGEETMEDYFGEKGQDFGAMLEGYDWSRMPAEEDGHRSGGDRRMGKGRGERPRRRSPR